MGIQIDNQKCSKFDYFYMLVIIIYLGQATRDTACMTGGSLIRQFVPIWAKLESQRELCSDTHFEYVGDPFLHLKKNNQRLIDFGRLYTDTSARLKLITIAKLLLSFVSFWK